MTNVWCVRAEFGTYTEDFIQGALARPVTGAWTQPAN
jgi:hypothetical protein